MPCAGKRIFKKPGTSLAARMLYKIFYYIHADISNKIAQIRIDLFCLNVLSTREFDASLKTNLVARSFDDASDASVVFLHSAHTFRTRGFWLNPK